MDTICVAIIIEYPITVDITIIIETIVANRIDKIIATTSIITLEIKI